MLFGNFFPIFQFLKIPLVRQADQSFINRLQDSEFSSITEETQFLVKQCYRLVCIARSFNRWLRLILRSEVRFQGGDA